LRVSGESTNRLTGFLVRGLHLFEIVPDLEPKFPFHEGDQVMAEMKEQIKDTIDTAAEKAKKATDKTSAKVKEVAKDVGSKVKEAGEKIKEQGD